MATITLPTDLEIWANQQVAKGAAASVDALVEQAVLASKKESDWLDSLVSDALEAAKREGWVEGDVMLAEIDGWIGELNQEIGESVKNSDQKKRA